jgi:hypothetical protein
VARELPYVGPPEGGRVFRVSRGFDVFAPQDWSWAQEDGTFGNRFDDPGKYGGMPEEDRFRMVYCATQRAGAFGETIARFRRNPRLGSSSSVLFHPLSKSALQGVKDFVHTLVVSTAFPNHAAFIQRSDQRGAIVVSSQFYPTLQSHPVRDIRIAFLK